MRRLLMLGLVGLVAQLIDGSLGMAYGVTSTTLLLTAGIAPAAASATVHLAELGTTLVSGAAHWRFGNINWRVVGLMSLPGGAGAFFGAVLLSSLSMETAVPVVSGFLFVLGLYILIRFARSRAPARERRLPTLYLAPLGLFAGFMDAVGGGGWGPIGTPALVSSGRIEPRRAIGSIDAAEFLVALGASVGFLVALDLGQLQLAWLGALLAGGVVAAPLAAWLVRSLPARVLGTAVGGLILLTNTRTFGAAIGVGGDKLLAGYLVIAALATVALSTAVVAHRREHRLAQAA